MGCIDDRGEATGLESGADKRHNVTDMNHEVARPLGCVHWTCALGMEARAVWAGEIQVRVQLTAVAGARSSAAAEVAGIHDCWLVGVGVWFLRVGD